MQKTIQQLLAGIVSSMGISDAVITVDMTENPEHGDYSTNIAMALAGRLKAPPMQIAKQIVDQINTSQTLSTVSWLGRMEIAPPGFINFFMSEVSFITQIEEVLERKDGYGAIYYSGVTQSVVVEDGSKQPKNTDYKSHGKIQAKSTQKNDVHTEGNTREKNAGAEKIENPEQTPSCGNPKTIMVEFAHPNTHKAFHIGHLRNITTGESIVRLLESQGNRVVRANYQGDVGMHIAKALYALLNVSPFKDEVHTISGIKTRVEFLGKAYAAGSKAFENPPAGGDEVKKIIGELNKQIYAKDPTLMPIYKETRQWSLDYFETIYKAVNTHFDRYYFESEVFEKGKVVVLDKVTKGIFEKSDGAIIFPGEKYGLHNRVFVTSDGNATYEAKDIALARLQFDEYHPDLIIHCVGPEQASYFQVIFKALEQVYPDTKGKEHHLIYGWVKLKEGKMSSRLGNVVLGEWLIDEVKKEIKNILAQSISKDNKSNHDVASETIAIGAIKYSFLKVSTPSEIAFDLQESINTNGDSGPYLQYAYARCKSVLRKAASLSFRPSSRNPSQKNWIPGQARDDNGMNPEERAIARRIMQFPDIVKAAADNYAPNTLCTYLFQLAQEFNLFYAKHAILPSIVIPASEPESRQEIQWIPGQARDDKASPRLALTAATAQVLKNGLYLLGINVLERM